ncbi:MAG: [acyl-carrier-protein] S-malonyltransferase [Firmicutes bacterium HGW-Firmicutes-1]|jgi:[acyl-carrier-protein] S-malonyltransferase|nr:MAG: [acyl-carrier-protein] S-malonyltransferase [Firmicutes bacterium HGW-Firmicutes-1]
MSKIAFVFPGQGAQYVGMGEEIIKSNIESKAIFDCADKILDFDLKEICFTQQEKINSTEYTQPALLTVSIAILKAIEELGIKPDYVAGLSLGEYSALVANGCIAFEDAVYLVRKRGQFMEEAARKTQGSMAAILGSDRVTIEEECKKASGIVGIANYNSPAQMVIAGEIQSVSEVSSKLSEKGIRVIPLNVSGAFHSILMKEAANQLETVLNDIQINSFETPYATNVTGEIITTSEEVKALLIQQVMSSVKWEDCIHSLIAKGVDIFVEIGPGKTLSGLIKKIDRSKKVVNIENFNGLQSLKKELEV